MWTDFEASPSICWPTLTLFLNSNQAHNKVANRQSNTISKPVQLQAMPYYNTFMYWFFDGLCFTTGVAQFVLSLVYKKTSLCWLGPVWIAVYPVLLQSLLNLFSSSSERVKYNTSPRSRFVYCSSYNISFCGIENFHPFDSKKYGNIFRRLLDRGLVNETDVITPGKVPRSLLLEVMSKCYLLKLCYTILICKYVEMPLIFLPGFLLRWRVLDPMLKATEGSILAACAAEQLGWAVNLSGGFHHASASQGGGFCIYPDITMIIHYMRTRRNMKRIMVIDLDAHQGNGHQRDATGDNDVYIVDFYNHKIYPRDYEAMEGIKKDVVVTGSTNDDEYIELVEQINEDFEAFKPQFVIYNAGTDILDGDPLGRMQITKNGIIRRDQTVLKICTKHKVPVVILLSGGYQTVNAEIIADSLENLMKKYN